MESKAVQSGNTVHISCDLPDIFIPFLNLDQNTFQQIFHFILIEILIFLF